MYTIIIVDYILIDLVFRLIKIYVSFCTCAYIALGLRSAIDNMAGYEDDALQIQITVFEEHQLADESQVPKISHHELLDKLRAKVKHVLSHFVHIVNRPIICIIYDCSIFRYQTRCTTRIYKTSYCECRKWITVIRKCKYKMYLVLVYTIYRSNLFSFVGRVIYYN